MADIPNTGDILQCSRTFAFPATYADFDKIADTAWSTGMDTFAVIPARQDSSTWSGVAVTSFYQAFWTAANSHTSDVVLNFLVEFPGFDTSYALPVTIPAKETIPIFHGLRLDATAATDIVFWADTADVIVIGGHTTRVVTDAQ